MPTACDFCYGDATPPFGWRAELKGPRPLEWHFDLCDHCRLLLRNVISVVMHKLTHSQMVEAIQAKMDELGITYDDLMDTSFLNPKQLEPPLNYSALDRSFDDNVGMGNA